MLEFIQHILGLCPDSHSHLTLLNLVREQGWINQIFQIIKYRIK